LQQTNNISPQKITKPLARFTTFIEKLLANQGGYLSDALYTFQPHNDNFKLQPTSKESVPRLRWLILGREHYFETSKDYPIANKRDLKQALLFDDSKAPFEGITLQHVERINEQSHRVTFWVINPKIIEALPSRPWLILPESYILAKALTKNIKLATVEAINKTLFMSNTGQGVISGIKSQQTSTIENFSFSTGSPFTQKSEEYLNVLSTEFASFLQAGLKSLNVSQLQGFLIKAKKIKWKNYPWQQASLITVSVFSLYITLSSAWLFFEQHQIDQQLTEQTSAVNQALTMQKQHQKQIRWQKQLTAPLLTKEPFWNVWPVVLESISIGATIKAIHYKKSQITLQGTADKAVRATDILAKLSGNRYVVQASFSKPVRKYRGKEEFSIHFNFSDAEFDADIVKETVQQQQGGSHAAAK